MLAARKMSEDKDDLEANPDIKSIPEEIDPSSSSSLEMVFNKLGLLLEKSMDINKIQPMMQVCRRRLLRKS